VASALTMSAARKGSHYEVSEVSGVIVWGLASLEAGGITCGLTLGRLQGPKNSKTLKTALPLGPLGFSWEKRQQRLAALPALAVRNQHIELAV